MLEAEWEMVLAASVEGGIRKIIKLQFWWLLVIWFQAEFSTARTQKGKISGGVCHSRCTLMLTSLPTENVPEPECWIPVNVVTF